MPVTKWLKPIWKGCLIYDANIRPSGKDKTTEWKDERVPGVRVMGKIQNEKNENLMNKNKITRETRIISDTRFLILICRCFYNI